MKNKLFPFLLSIIIFGACNGTQKDCSKLLNQEIRFPKGVENFDICIDEFINKYQQLFLCEFDTIDYLIMKESLRMSPEAIYAEMFNEHIERNWGKVQYKFAINLFEKFKKSKSYTTIRKKKEKNYEFNNRKISQSNWNSNKISLEESGFNQEQIKELKNIADSNKSIETYGELVILYKQIERQRLTDERLRKIEIEKSTGMSELVEGFSVYIDYEKGRNEAKNKNKKILLCFTAKAVDHCMEMFRLICASEQIKKIINDNYVMICLYINDKTELKSTDAYYSETLKKNIERQGLVYLEMQVRDYNVNTQPFFVLLDLNGKEIARDGYVRNVEEYENFLKKGI